MDNPTAAVPTPPPVPGRRRRLWRWLLGALAVLVAVAGLAIAFGPQLVARHVVSTYLAGINIDTSGVDTLRIRPLQGRLTFGPVTFRGGTAEQAGQVGRIGVKVDVTRLLRRQALVEAIVIEGVRFEVRQAADGALSLNGIPLSEILAEHTTGGPERPPAPEGAPPGAQPGAPAPARPITPRTLEEELGWGAGLDSLQILDSRVVFIDARGGEAVMHVHELDLGGFRTWAPDKPGRYRLQAEINDIDLAASGIAKPFADKIELEAEASVTGIEVTKIERYLGPLGFTSRAGRIDLSVYESGFVLFAAGSLQARLAASGTMTGVDLAHPLFGRGRLATGKLTLENVAGSYDGPGRGGVSGDVGVDLQASEMRLYDGTEVGFSHVRLGLPGTTVRMEAGQQPAVRVAPQLDVTDLRLGGGDIRGTVGNTTVRLSGFSIEGTEPGAPFVATGSVAVERIDLLLPEAQPVTVAADRVLVDLAETRLAFPPGRGAQVAGGVVLDTSRLAVSVQPAPPRGPDARRRPPPPTRIEAARLAFEMPALTVDDAGEAGMTVDARGPMLSFDDVRLGGPVVQGSVGQAAFRLARFGMQGKDAGAPMVATGTVQVDRLDLRLPDVEPVAIALGQLRAELEETRIALAPGAPRVEGGLSLDTRDLRVSIQEQGRRGAPMPPPTRIEAAAFAARLPNVALQDGGTDKPVVRAGDPRLTLDGLRLGGPDIQGTVGTADIRIAGADVETGEPGTPVVVTGTVLAQGLDLLVPDIEPIGIGARELDAKLIGTRFAFPSGRVLIEGGVAVDTDDLTVSIYQQGPDGKPAAPIRIDARKFAGQVPTLRVDDSRATGTKVNVGTPFLALERFRLDAPADPLSTLQLAASRMALQRIDVNVIDAQTLEVSGTGNIIAPDLSLAVVRAGGGSAGPNGTISRLGLDLQRFSYREDGEVNGFGMQGRIDIGSLQGRRPFSEPGRPADELSLSGLQLDVADVDVEVGGGKPSWRARLDMELASLAAALRTPAIAMNGRVDSVSLRRLAAASTDEYALETLTVGRIDGAVTRETAAPKVPKPKPEEDAHRAARTWPPADLPAVRVGRVALVQGGRVAFRDRAVSPPVDATLLVERLTLADVDTTDPQARTTLDVLARLGDGVLDVRGWAEAFQARPSFEMQARLDELSLPMVSPYIAPDLGFDVLRGRLTLGASAVVTEGQLDGEIRARIVDVRMADRPRPETPEVQTPGAETLVSSGPQAGTLVSSGPQAGNPEAGGPGGDATGAGADGDRQAASSIARPLSTMIRLIEDRDGAIEVAMPVHGDLLSPDFSYMRVVWDLLPRLLRAFVISPVSFVSAAWSLMAAGGTGGSDGTAAAAKP